MSYKRFLWRILIVVGLALLAAGTVLAYVDQTELAGYTIDLVEMIPEPDTEQSTWVYAVTANEGVPNNGLSHWSLGIGSCYTVVAPAVDTIYTTPINDYGCGSVYTCSQASYLVLYDAGMSSTITDGIKFETENAEEELGPGNLTTQIFEVTIEKAPEEELRQGETYVDVKLGDDLYAGTILGPVCAPNAVQIADLRARARVEYWAVTGLVGFVVLILVRRRRSW